MAKKQTKSILQGLYDDYGLLPQEQDPKKVADIVRRLADGMESGEVGLLGFTFGFTAHVDSLPRAVIDLDFIENKLIQDKRATAPKKKG
jgi:hypothetical protein